METQLQNLELISDFDLTEVINGIEYMSPAPNPRHQVISILLTGKIIENIDIRSVVYAPYDLLLLSGDRLQPDILIYATKEDLKKKLIPKVVFEIISPSSFFNDRIKKFNIYQAEGIQEYWLVDPETDSVEVYNLLNGTYHLHARVIRQGEVRSIAFPNLKFQIEDIFN